MLDFDSPNNDSADNEAYLKNVGRISLSGVQPMASVSKLFKVFLSYWITTHWYRKRRTAVCGTARMVV